MRSIDDQCTLTYTIIPSSRNTNNGSRAMSTSSSSAKTSLCGNIETSPREIIKITEMTERLYFVQHWTTFAHYRSQLTSNYTNKLSQVSLHGTTHESIKAVCKHNIIKHYIKPGIGTKKFDIEDVLLQDWSLQQLSKP